MSPVNWGLIKLDENYKMLRLKLDETWKMSFNEVKTMVTTITESAMRQHQSNTDHRLVFKLLILNRFSRRF